MTLTHKIIRKSQTFSVQPNETLSSIPIRIGGSEENASGIPPDNSVGGMVMVNQIGWLGLALTSRPFQIARIWKTRMGAFIPKLHGVRMYSVSVIKFS